MEHLTKTLNQWNVESCLEDVKSVQIQIPKWIEEYNTYAPHSAINMMTPTEFLNFNQAA